MPAKDLKQFILWTLRKASYRWTPRGQAFRAASASAADFKKRPGEKVTARVRNFYSCATCKKVFSRKGVSADHIVPVVDPKKGWEGLEKFCERLFCEADGFQILCKTDHDAKTKKEGLVRTKQRRLKKL